MTRKNILISVLVVLMISLSFVGYKIHQKWKKIHQPLVKTLSDADVDSNPWEILEKYTQREVGKEFAGQSCDYLPTLKDPVIKMISNFYQIHYFGVNKPVTMKDFLIFMEYLDDALLLAAINERDEVYLNPSREFSHSGQFWNDGAPIERWVTVQETPVKIKVARQLGGEYKLYQDKFGEPRAALVFNEHNIQFCKKYLWWEACTSLKAIYLSKTGILVVFDRKEANFCARF